MRVLERAVIYIYIIIIPMSLWDIYICENRKRLYTIASLDD